MPSVWGEVSVHKKRCCLLQTVGPWSCVGICYVLCVDELTALCASLVRPLQLSLLIWWWGTTGHQLFSGHVLVSVYTFFHFGHHDCISTHSTSWSSMPQVLSHARIHICHLFIVGLLSLLYYSPGEVVVFQCVEFLREHIEEKLLHQGSSGEEEKERECSAGNMAVCKLTMWHMNIGSCRSI